MIEINETTVPDNYVNVRTNRGKLDSEDYPVEIQMYPNIDGTTANVYPSDIGFTVKAYNADVVNLTRMNYSSFDSRSRTGTVASQFLGTQSALVYPYFLNNYAVRATHIVYLLLRFSFSYPGTLGSRLHIPYFFI